MEYKKKLKNLLMIFLAILASCLGFLLIQCQKRAFLKIMFIKFVNHVYPSFLKEKLKAFTKNLIKNAIFQLVLMCN